MVVFKNTILPFLIAVHDKLLFHCNYKTAPLIPFVPFTRGVAPSYDVTPLQGYLIMTSVFDLQTTSLAWAKISFFPNFGLPSPVFRLRSTFFPYSLSKSYLFNISFAKKSSYAFKNALNISCA